MHASLGSFHVAQIFLELSDFELLGHAVLDVLAEIRADVKSGAKA